jgi:DNA-binding response OmpR family regulator
MNSSKALIISDHHQLARTWEPGITQTGVQVTVIPCSEVSKGLQDLDDYDLLIVDAYADDYDFVALCRNLRRDFLKVILLLTYDRDERFHLMLYAAGVDETVVKPLGVPLFVAKVSAWLHRAALRSLSEPEAPLRTATFLLDARRKRLVTVEGKSTRLSSLECRLLALLMSNRGLVLETDLLIDRVWTNYQFGDKALLKNLVYRLRRKIEPDPNIPRYIHTVSGQGYLFRAD